MKGRTRRNKGCAPTLGEFSKQTSVWMRPDTFKAVRHRAIDEGTPIYAVIDRAILHYLETVPLREQAAAS